MKIKQILSILSEIGISPSKAEIYLACLEVGRATAYFIAKKTGKKRPSVYDILNQLTKDGLVYKSIKGNKKYYSPAEPSSLLRKIKEKEERIKSIMPDLEDIFVSPKIKPFIRYFEGEEGIKEMYEDSLRTLKKGEEILAFVGEDVLKYLPRHTADYVRRRVEKGIRLRGIYKKGERIMEYMKHNQGQLRNAMVLDQKNFSLNNEINIYRDKVAFFNYGKEMFGMIIESGEVARSQKVIFELAWRGAKGINNESEE